MDFILKKMIWPSLRIKYICVFTMKKMFSLMVQLNFGVGFNGLCHDHNRPWKKSLGSHQLPRLILHTQKKRHAPRQILSLGKHVKCMHFSDMVFSLALVIFHFFLMRIKTFIFQFPPKKEEKKKIACPRYFSIFFWWEPRHLFFVALSYKTECLHNNYGYIQSYTWTK